MAASNLIARYTLQDGFGNRAHLHLREAANQELVAILTSLGGMPLALSNLQMREALPAFWDGYSATLKQVDTRLVHCVYKVVAREQTPARPRARR